MTVVEVRSYSRYSGRIRDESDTGTRIGSSADRTAFSFSLFANEYKRETAIDSTFSALGIDSLDAADLLFAVEDAFGILVPDAAAQSMRTVGEVVEGVRRLLAERPSVV